MVTIAKKEVIKFIERFNYKKKESKHLTYDIYNKDGKQLNLRPIIIPRDKKNYFEDTGIKLLADSFGIGQQFLKKLLNGGKTIEDYEREVLYKKLNK